MQTEHGMSDPNYYGRLAGDSYGGFDDERAPLVLLHGLAFDRRQWGPAVNELRLIDDHRRVLVVDLPGVRRLAPFRPVRLGRGRRRHPPDHGRRRHGRARRGWALARAAVSGC